MMRYLVLVFGLAVVLIGLLGVVSPAQFKRLLGAWNSQSRFVFAIVMGIVLLLAADDLRFSFVMKILGVLTLVAAVGIAIMGRERLDRLINWWLGRHDTLLRVSTLLAAAFGGFLVYVAL